ncbi:hypothetical protein A1D22_01090 [Pasteurellaceae bacterium LFhippo2]|nr:hypothetical protein [Pasteurellaceae bacterium LFhippo2]
MILYLLIYLLLMNLFSAYMMYLDKQKSIKGEWRIPEFELFCLALLGGFIGTYLVMKYARHKTKHWQFYAVVILSALIWLVGLPAGYICLNL